MRRPRTLRSFASRVAAGAIAVVALAFAALDVGSRVAVERALARTRADGGELDPRAFLAVLPKGERNASDGLTAIDRLLRPAASRETDPDEPGWWTRRLGDLTATDGPEIDAALAGPEARLALQVLDLYADVGAARALDATESVATSHGDGGVERAFSALRVAKLVRGRAFLALRDGRFDDAYRDAALVRRIGDWLLRERPGLVGSILGHGVERIGLRMFEDLALLAPPAPEVRRRLADDVAGWLARGAVYGVVGERAVVLARADGMPAEPEGSWLPPALSAWRRRLDRAETYATYSALVEYASTPPHRRPVAGPNPPPVAPWWPQIGQPMLLTNSVAAIDKADAVAMRCELAQVALAWEAEAAAGPAPRSPEDLVPAALPSLPVDRFSGAPLRYLRDDTGCRLWSIGPNRRDDGGVGRTRPAEGPEDDVVWSLPCLRPAAPG